LDFIELANGLQEIHAVGVGLRGYLLILMIGEPSDETAWTLLGCSSSTAPTAAAF
jgi:hypothetical protein